MDQEMNFDLDKELTPEGPPESFTDKLTWFFKGFIFPLWSRDFYKQAAARRMGAALVFLLGFALLQTIVTTTSIANNLFTFGREIEAAYQKGEIPDMRIENGAASVSGTGKYLIENNRQFFGIDTTGELQRIDTSRFSEGLLLTRTEIHFVNEDGYQVLLLSDLNDTFGNPIILDGASVSRLWSGAAVFISVAVLFGGFLFYSFGRFAYLALLGLLVWGAASLGKKQVNFAPIMITGIYANVPATYAMFILRKAGLTFCGLGVMILLLIWGLAVASVLKNPPPGLQPGEIPGDFD